MKAPGVDLLRAGRPHQAEASDKPYTYEGTNADKALQAAIFAQRKSEYEFKLEGYKQKIDGLVSVIARSEADASGYRDRLAVAQNLQNMRMELERLNVGSKLNTLAAVDNRAEMARFLANAMQTAESGKRDLAAMIAERDGYVQQWHADVSQQLSDAGSKLSDAQELLHKADLRRKLVELRADRDATVLTVAKVSPGSVMQPGQQFFTLMPADAPLAVEGILPGSEGGFVHIGDPVAIKFDTFEYAHYGMAYGTVRSLSADTFFGSDQQAAQAPPCHCHKGEPRRFIAARSPSIASRCAMCRLTSISHPALRSPPTSRSASVPCCPTS